MRKVAGRQMNSALSTTNFAPRPFVGPQGPKRRPLDERFWSKVEKTDGCWLWRGANNGRYGQIAIDGARREAAHRVAFVLANGAVPEGLCVLYRCDNPRCVRPDHLFLGTQADNMADMVAKGRNRSQKGQEK